MTKVRKQFKKLENYCSRRDEIRHEIDINAKNHPERCNLIPEYTELQYKIPVLELKLEDEVKNFVKTTSEYKNHLTYFRGHIIRKPKVECTVSENHICLGINKLCDYELERLKLKIECFTGRNIYFYPVELWWF